MLAEPMQYFGDYDKKIIHMTTKFVGRRESEYDNLEIVKKSMGKLYHLTIIGYVITPRLV